MKKFNQISMAVLVVFAVFAASAIFSSCNKFEQDEKGIDGYPEIPTIDSVKIEHQRLTRGEYANGEIRYECLDSVWAFVGEEIYPGTATCICKWQVNRADVRLLPEDTCMSITATADPRNMIFGNNNAVVTLLSSSVQQALVSVDGIEYSVKNQIVALGHKCLTIPYRVCANGTQITFWGREDENPDDTIAATGDRSRVDTVPVHHYDTLVIERHDTTFIIVYDTTFVIDTVTHDTTRVVVDSVVYSPHHLGEANLTFVANVLHAQCSNSITKTVFRDGQIYTQTNRNFSGNFDFQYSETGAYLTSHVGQARPISVNGVNWGNGFTQSFTHQPHYTNPAGYEAWLRYLGCDFILDSAYGQSNGILVAGHYTCPDGNHRKTILIPKNPTNPDNPTITRVDTLWLNCTTASASYLAMTDQVQVTKNRTYRKINVWSDSHRDTSSTVYTATFNHLYNVSKVGQPTTGMINNIPVTVMSNTASFGGGAFTETLSSANGDRFCSDDWVSATLTSNGTVWSGAYGTSTYTVLVPETFVTHTPWEDVVYMVVTDGYEQQIFSAQTQRHQFLEVITYNSATGYKKFYKDVTNMPLVMPSRSSCDSSSITATTYNFYVTAAGNGYYATQVIPHNGNTTLPDGVVKSQELTNWWQLTYNLAPSNSLAYVMGGSSWTMAGDNGRNALRGIADTTNHTITVNYGTSSVTWGY